MKDNEQMSSREAQDHIKANRILVHKSTFCSIVIFNGLLVSLLCYFSVRPVYLERVEQLNTIEARQELTYLYGLIGLGALTSTVTALVSLPFFKNYDRKDILIDKIDDRRPSL